MLRFYLCAGQNVVVIFTQFKRFANIYYRSLAHGAMLLLLFLLLLLLLATRYGFFRKLFIVIMQCLSHSLFATLPHAQPLQFEKHCCKLRTRVLVLIKPASVRHCCCAALSLSARVVSLREWDLSLPPSLPRSLELV